MTLKNRLVNLMDDYCTFEIACREQPHHFDKYKARANECRAEFVELAASLDQSPAALAGEREAPTEDATPSELLRHMLDWHAAVTRYGAVSETAEKHFNAIAALASRPTTQAPAVAPDLLTAALLVEEWWVGYGMDAFNGAPACMFALREAIAKATEVSK